MLLCQQTHKPLSYYHMVRDAEPPFIVTRISRMHQKWPNIILIYEGSIACCRLLSHNHHLPSPSWCRLLCQKWELFYVKLEVKSQWTVLVWYLTILTDVNCYQTRCQRQQCHLPLSNTAHVCTSAWCAQHSSTAAAQNSTSVLLSYGPKGQSWTQMITRSRESTAAWIWVISQQNCRNQTATGWTLEKQ